MKPKILYRLCNIFDEIKSQESPQIFKPRKILKRSFINAFPCVVAFALNLVLRHLKVLNF